MRFTGLLSPLSLPHSVLRSCWVTSRPAGQRPSGTGGCFLLPKFWRHLRQPDQPRLPQQPHSRHSAQGRRRLVLREETLKPWPRQGPQGERPGSPGSRVCWPLWLPQHLRPSSQSRLQAYPRPKAQEGLLREKPSSPVIV